MPPLHPPSPSTLQAHVRRKSRPRQLTLLWPAVAGDKGLKSGQVRPWLLQAKPFRPCDFMCPRAQGSMQKGPQLALHTARG